MSSSSRQSMPNMDPDLIHSPDHDTLCEVLKSLTACREALLTLSRRPGILGRLDDFLQDAPGQLDEMIADARAAASSDYADHREDRRGEYLDHCARRGLSPLSAAA